MEKFNSLGVFLEEKKVGTLALYKERFCAFEYTEEWLSDGFSLNPYSLPLEKKVFIPKIEPFDGLFGVFSDSLPDGWGQLLVDRMLLSHQIDPSSVGPLNRLAIVGNSGMGALSYRPEIELSSKASWDDLDSFSEKCRQILQTDFSEDLDRIFALGGSSGGARPKILTEYENEPWIIKFPTTQDPKTIGRMEYEYSLCAKKCGIEVPEVRLFPSKVCDGYFGCKRFDRICENSKEKRIHMMTVSALLETSHRIPSLDYMGLHNATFYLTKDHREVEKMFRLMCFNIFSHNRDDHSKNFSFLYRDGNWKLSPAYDLTYSNSLGGEHATCVCGNGKNPGMTEILKVADKAGLKQEEAKRIAEFVRDTVQDMLSEFI